ncbi:MAG: leucine-rich repeat domain-containing protein [Eubacterium sp.]|nr:leucine-rich repeat domain-containing protein [Eubacterium sp.]
MKKNRQFLSVMVTVFVVLSMFYSTNVYAAKDRAASYNSDYRHWNQSDSAYSEMRLYGCFTVAQAKMLYEAGVNRSQMNPDFWYTWLRANGCFRNPPNDSQWDNYSIIMDNCGGAASYATSQGFDATYWSGWDATYDQIWFNINAGYYTICDVGGHFVLVDNQTSKSTGKIYIYDSYEDGYSWWTDNSRCLLSRYSVSAIHVYKINGSSNIQLWGISEGETFSGTKKLWAKRSDTDSNHYAVFYLDGKAITGHLSADDSGFFAVNVDTNKFDNGSHEFKIEYVNTTSSSTDIRNITFNNLGKLWCISEGETFSGTKKLWAKRFDSDSNHYAVFYIDGTAITGHLSSDDSGYFAVNVDTSKYANGSHEFKFEYVNSNGSWTDKRNIIFSNTIEHEYGELIQEVSASCTEDGMKAHYECSECHKLFIKDGDNYIEKTAAELKIPATEHKYNQEIVADKYLKSKADCTHAAVYYKSCKCGEAGTETFESGNPLGHDYKNVEGTANDVTCTEDGKEADQKCTRCNDIKEGAAINTTGHEYNQEIVADKYLKSKADCTHSAVYYKSCKCGEKGTETFESGKPLGHDYKNIEGTAKGATCTEDGKNADQKCTRCNDEIKGTVIKAKGHSIVIDKGIPATKTSIGLTDGSHCSICNVTIIRQQVIPALGIDSTTPNPTDDKEQDAGSGVGKISADGTVLTDTDNVKYYVSGKLKNKDLKKNLKIADKKSGGKYKITKVIKKKGKVVGGNATYMAPYNRNCTKATAGATVKLGGVSFKITAINANAFKNCNKLTTFKAGGNITTIGKNAFNGCSSLKSVTITSTKLKSIGSGAFKGTTAKTKFKVPKSKLAKYSKMIYKAGANKKAKITK